MSKYGYSFCEERYSGPFDSLDEALSEARSACPEATHVWIGEVRLPEEFICKELLGRHIEEHISERLGDEVGEVAENFVLDKEMREALGTLVLDWIKFGPGFDCWGVKNVQEVEINSPERDTATVDMFAGQEGGAA